MDEEEEEEGKKDESSCSSEEEEEEDSESETEAGTALFVFNHISIFLIKFNHLVILKNNNVDVCVTSSRKNQADSSGEQQHDPHPDHSQRLISNKPHQPGDNSHLTS